MSMIDKETLWVERKQKFLKHSKRKKVLSLTCKLSVNKLIFKVNRIVSEEAFYIKV